MSNQSHCSGHGASDLQDIWHIYVREHALVLAGQVIGPETPLSDIVAVLRFLADRGIDCSRWRLGEVLRAVPSNNRPETRHLPRRSKPQAESVLSTAQPSSVRDSDDVERLKASLVRMLVGTLQPQTTDDVLRTLRRTGEDLQWNEVQEILVALQAEGRILRHPQNTRAWMFRPQGHTQAQGFTIKRAETSPVPTAAPTAPHSAPPSPYHAAPASEPVSAEMQALGKPATHSERERLQGMLVLAAKLRGLPLQRSDISPADASPAADDQPSVN